MAKRGNVDIAPSKAHPHKTAKRLAAKKLMLAAKKRKYGRATQY